MVGMLIGCDHQPLIIDRQPINPEPQLSFKPLMATGNNNNNWISFSFPPPDMVLRPYTYTYVDDPLPICAVAGSFFGDQPLALATMDASAQDSSSALSGAHYQATDMLALTAACSEAEDAASANGPRPHAAKKKKKTAVAVVRQRTSIYRGVTKHRWTGRYEAHLWDSTCWRVDQKRKGRQVYLGGYDKEENAARAYDLAALKYWGLRTTTNFPLRVYSKELDEMQHMTKPEFVASLRRKSSGFSRGASVYRGVTRHHQHQRWQARIGRVAGNKDLYLGTFSTEEEAAEAYDVAAIKFRGVNAVTNFEHSRYNVEAIASTELPIGATSIRIKRALQTISSSPVTVASPVASQNLNVVPASFHVPASFPNLLQLYPASSPSGSLPHPGISENYPDMYTQRLHWLAAHCQYDDLFDSKHPAEDSSDPLLDLLVSSQ